MKSYTRNFSRRDVIKAAGAAGAGGIAGCLDNTGNTGNNGPSGDKQTLTIGVIEPFTGFQSYWGDMRMWGFLSGLAYKYDMDPITEFESGSTITFETEDTVYEMLLRDGQYNGARAEQMAIELVQEDEVDMIVGVGSSEGVIRVIESVVTTAQVPFISGFSSSTDFTTQSDLCTDLAYHPGENVAMQARTMAPYIAEESEVESVYLLGPQSNYGNAFVREHDKAFQENGVEVTGSRNVPPGYSQFQGLLQNAADSGAESIAVTFTAQTLVNFTPAFTRGNLSGDFDMRLFSEFPGENATNIFANVLSNVLDEINEETLAETKIGPSASRYHWNQYDNEINQEFIEMYYNAYGKLPDFFSSTAFATSSALVQAVEEGGSVDPMDIVDQLNGMTVRDTPKGENGYEFQTYNNQAKSAMTMTRQIPAIEDRWGAPIQPSDPIFRVSKDETTMPQDDPDMQCSLS